MRDLELLDHEGGEDLLGQIPELHHDFSDESTLDFPFSERFPELALRDDAFFDQKIAEAHTRIFQGYFCSHCVPACPMPIGVTVLLQLPRSVSPENPEADQYILPVISAPIKR